MANARSRYVVNQINLLRPTFTVHLGDLVHPVPSLPSYDEAMRQFQELYRAIEGDLHVVPGNHDVGDKPLDWMPAGTVTQEHIGKYKNYMGMDYYSFDREPCHFVVINAQLLNTGFPNEAEQRRWLEEDLEEHAGKRVFLFTHYPPYIADPTENGHYDNLDEPGRGWLLDLCRLFDIEAIYAGHVHNFFYNRFGDTDIHILPSVCFVRQDYSEAFRVEPADEYGRNDVAKLGFFAVKVYENGHVNALIRTAGATLGPDESTAASTSTARARHSREAVRAPVGLDLRASWTEWTEIPPSGSLDEFARKRIRNDYPLMALWEMGTQRLRVPLNDAADKAVRSRMRTLRRMGHTYTFYAHASAIPDAKALLSEIADITDGFEVIARWREDDQLPNAIRCVKEWTGARVFFSKLWSAADLAHQGSRYYHFIKHGFLPDDEEEIRTCFEQLHDAADLDGLVFRLGWSYRPWDAIRRVYESASRSGMLSSVHVQLAGETPAEDRTDDLANANRVAETLAAASVLDLESVFIDTFVDHDRGYFVRNGLVDRRYNPRMGARVFRHLAALLEDLQPDADSATMAPFRDGNLWTAGSSDDGKFALLLPDRLGAVHRLHLQVSGATAEATLTCLDSGRISIVSCETTGEGVGFHPPIKLVGPTVLQWRGVH